MLHFQNQRTPGYLLNCRVLGWFPKSYVKMYDEDETLVQDKTSLVIAGEAVQTPSHEKVANLATTFENLQICSQPVTKHQLSKGQW